MLTSIDLFTGIAGFTLALDCVCQPALYCDNDPHVLLTLAELMDKGTLPRCPVVDDVRDVAAMKTHLKGVDVDVVTAGFPCTGFSSIGARKGLKNEGSALFFDILRIVKEFDPKFVMLENVAAIVNRTHAAALETIVESMQTMGYDIRWTTCSAASVGAPHTRNRWFCLCTRKGGVMPRVPIGHSRNIVTQWSSKKEPPLMGAQVDGYRRRSSMLGNSIVPITACLAFYRLYSGFEILTLKDLLARKGGTTTFHKSVAKLAGVATPSSELLSVSDKVVCAHGIAHGIVISVAQLGDRQSFRVLPFDVPVTPNVSNAIVVEHDHYTDTHLSAQRETFNRAGVSHKSPLVTHTIHRDMWPTVRANLHGTGHVLTERMAGDLHTTARFASSVRGKKQPRTSSDQWVSIEWLEWLMGYKAGHTLFKKCPKTS